jgi:hypothetical protein
MSRILFDRKDTLTFELGREGDIPYHAVYQDDQGRTSVYRCWVDEQGTTRWVIFGPKFKPESQRDDPRGTPIAPYV